MENIEVDMTITKNEFNNGVFCATGDIKKKEIKYLNQRDIYLFNISNSDYFNIIANISNMLEINIHHTSYGPEWYKPIGDISMHMYTKKWRM